MTLPTDPKARKALPITTGVLDYFPLAIAAVSAVSKAGNDQHNPGQPLHWARGKSMDQADTIVRHLMERGTLDTDGHRHSAKVAWRALALLQLEIEQAEGLPISRGSVAGVEKVVPEQLELPYADTFNFPIRFDPEDGRLPNHPDFTNTCFALDEKFTSAPEHQTSKTKRTRKEAPYEAPRSRRRK